MRFSTPEICADDRTTAEKVGGVPQKGFRVAGEGSATEVVPQARRRSQERRRQHPRRRRERHIQAQGARLEVEAQGTRYICTYL